MKKHTQKYAAALLAVFTMISAFSGCGNNNGAGTSSETASAANSTTGYSETEPDKPVTEKPLSNPVAMTPDGDVDMTVALSYQTDFDALMKQLDALTVSEDHPVSQNSNPETVALYQYLRSVYGKQVLAAQQVGSNTDKEALAYYYYSDDLPAIKGFDFIFKTTPAGDGSDWTQMAIDWHTKSNGIVYFCWHWNVTCDIDNENSTLEAFYTEGAGNPYTKFSLKNAVTPGTKEYEVVVHDIDLIAYELQRLESAGVPVLWRPLHEASGSWFWWGLKDKESIEYYRKLWYMLYDRLENYHKLTNLIWVWNGQTKHNEVHPNTYDISGIDVYPQTVDHSVQSASYKKLSGFTAEGKMLALTECGYIPDPDELAQNIDTVKWLFYMPWNGEFIFKGSSLLGIPRINEDKMSKEFFVNSIKSDIVISWSELPDFEGTTRELPEKIQDAAYDIQQQRLKDAESE